VWVVTPSVGVSGHLLLHYDGLETDWSCLQLAAAWADGNEGIINELRSNYVNIWRVFSVFIVYTVCLLCVRTFTIFVPFRKQKQFVVCAGIFVTSGLLPCGTCAV
jgi:ABC-type multidrug transport system permease subunit